MRHRPPREALPEISETDDLSSTWIWEPGSIGKRIALASIAALERHYAETKNPAFVWRARQTAIESLPDLDSPALRWIDEYLVETTMQLARLVEDPPPSEVNSSIAAALGFDAKPGPGRGSAFQKARLLIRDIDLAAQVMHRLRFEDGKESEAIAHVAEKNRLSQTTVGYAFRSFKASVSKVR